MRYKNGYVDNGNLVNNNDPNGQSCPNCGSKNFKETVSREKCNNCGYEVDYWGKGGNDIAWKYIERKNKEEQIRRENEYKKEQDEWEAYHNQSDYDHDVY